MKRLTKIESYAVLWLLHNKKDVSEIVEELHLENKQVTGVMEKNGISASENPIKTKNSSAATRSKELMIHHTSEKRQNSVAIMTKEASEINDSIKYPAAAISKSIEKSIHRPKK